MKITAAIVSSISSSVSDSVFFCRPDCEENLSRYLDGYQFDWLDWAEIELPDSVVIEEPGYGKPEYVALDLDAYEKNHDTSITAEAARKYDPKTGKWTREIYIVCRCGFETAWARTVEY